MSGASRSELAALLAAVKDQPGERAPRLVVADWLEEHGDAGDCARAELIRLHWELQGVHLGNAGCERRVKELLVRHRGDWLGPLEIDNLCWTIQGGWLGLVVSLKDWSETRSLLEQKAQEAPQAWAWVEKLKLLGLGDQDDLRPLLSEPMPAGFSSLDMGFNYLGDDRLRLASFLTWPLVRQVSAVAFHVNALRVEGTEMVLRALAGGEVRALDLGHNHLADPSVERLADSELLEQLTSLVLFGNGISDAGVCRLAGSPHLGPLRALDLSFNDFGAEGAQALSCPRLASLIELNLEGNPLGEQGVGALSASPYLTSLCSLKLRNTGLGPAGVGALAGSANCRKLRALDLARCAIQEEGVRALVRSPHLAGLEYLSLEDNHLDDESARVLADAEGRAGLRQLRLGRNRLGDEGVRWLARSPLLAGLTELDLRKNGIGTTGCQALVQSPHLRSLRALYLGGNPIRKTGVPLLAERFGPVLNLDEG
jgi:uncharacterized protein (TIGR02996 family)